jgi:hypothetical protein
MNPVQSLRSFLILSSHHISSMPRSSNASVFPSFQDKIF